MIKTVTTTKQEIDKRKKSFFFYSPKDVDTNDKKGFSYKTANALIENVIAKKELTLFSEQGGELAVTSSTQEFIDRKGKNVNLTTPQLKLLTAFAQVVNSLLGTEAVASYVRSLPSNIEDRERDDNGQTKRLPNSVRCVIDIPQITKLIYNTNRVGGKQLDKVRENIRELSEVSQVFKFKDSRGGTFTVEAPIITLGKRIKYETKDGVVKLNKVEVFFEDVFVYEINDRYTLSPITLLQLWNEVGMNNELFTKLLFLLQYVRGSKVKGAHEAVKAKRVELRKEKKSDEEITTELDRLKRDKLTYKESLISILERLSGKRYKVVRKGTAYPNMANAKADLEQAENALLHMGIIKEYYESTGATGDVVCNFVLNENWLNAEANKLKKLLPSDGQEESAGEATN